MSEQDHDDFWGDDSGRRSSPRRKSEGGKDRDGKDGGSGGGGGGGLSESQRKALPIVAAAAALLLIVVIFVVSRSSDSTTNKSTGSSDSEQVTTGADGGTTAASGSTSGSTPVKKPEAKWSNGLVGSPLVFRDPQGNASSDPQPGKTAKPGVYFWEAYDGWHVRIVRGDGIDKVDGLVTGLLKKQGAKIVKVTGADPSVAKAEGGNVSWQVPAGGSGIVGIDFTLDAFTKDATLSLNGDNGSLDVKKIYIGSSTKNPPSNPITFVKKSPS